MVFVFERRVGPGEWQPVGDAQGISGNEAGRTALEAMADVAGGPGIYRMKPRPEFVDPDSTDFAHYRIEDDGKVTYLGPNFVID